MDLIMDRNTDTVISHYDSKLKSYCDRLPVFSIVIGKVVRKQ